MCFYLELSVDISSITQEHKTCWNKSLAPPARPIILSKMKNQLPQLKISSCLSFSSKIHYLFMAPTTILNFHQTISIIHIIHIIFQFARFGGKILDGILKISFAGTNNSKAANFTTLKNVMTLEGWKHAAHPKSIALYRELIEEIFKRRKTPFTVPIKLIFIFILNNFST